MWATEPFLTADCSDLCSCTMEKKEYKVILEAQLPRSYQPDDANEKDGQQGE